MVVAMSTVVDNSTRRQGWSEMNVRGYERRGYERRGCAVPAVGMWLGCYHEYEDRRAGELWTGRGHEARGMCNGGGRMDPKGPTLSTSVQITQLRVVHLWAPSGEVIVTTASGRVKKLQWYREAGLKILLIPNTSPCLLLSP